MKLVPIVLAFLAVLPALTRAQSAPPQPVGPAAEVQAAYSRLKPNILKAADRMPAENYSYKATPEVRTYGRVVGHIIEVQMHVCTAITGDKFDPASVPPENADKAALVGALKASFDECDKAYASLTDAGLQEAITFGPMKRTKIGAAWSNISHDNEQYATLALYLRLKGLVPPSSEK